MVEASYPCTSVVKVVAGSGKCCLTISSWSRTPAQVAWLHRAWQQRFAIKVSPNRLRLGDVLPSQRLEFDSAIRGFTVCAQHRHFEARVTSLKSRSYPIGYRERVARDTFVLSRISGNAALIITYITPVEAVLDNDRKALEFCDLALDGFNRSHAERLGDLEWQPSRGNVSLSTRTGDV